MYSHFTEMEKQMKDLEISISTEQKQDRLDGLMSKYAELTDKFHHSGGYEYKSRATGILRGLGFNENQFDLGLKNLSGGQKTRLALQNSFLQSRIFFIRRAYKSFRYRSYRMV